MERKITKGTRLQITRPCGEIFYAIANHDFFIPGDGWANVTTITINHAGHWQIGLSKGVRTKLNTIIPIK
jgi:hypothetical protein